MLNLKELGQPYEFWEYFDKISKIPRCSREEDKIRNFIKLEAEKFGFETKIDGIGNIAVKIPVPDQKFNCVLQCHMDMVCEKNEGVEHDFSKDPLKLKLIDIEGEKWITADGTTLGADNGVGICYLLLLMKKIYDNDLKFNSLGLDLLFTVREEYDMGGAKNIDSELVDGKYLINLDSGHKSITIGCTGGIGYQTRIKKESIFIERDKLKMKPYKIFISGLVGGHSGTCNKGQAHAIKLLSQILWKLNKKYNFHLNYINGGGAANAIPREAYSIIFFKENLFSEIKSFVFDIFDELKIQFEGIEENMTNTLEHIDDFSNNEALSKNVQDKLLDLLYSLPNGPITMHPTTKDLMFTSTNLGKIRTREDHVKLRWLHRSLSKYHNRAICERITTLLELSGLNRKNEYRESYPPWEPNLNSKLLKIAQDAYKELFDEEIPNKITHGGLETTLLIDKIPGIDAIAFGARSKGLHSPDERLAVKSVGRTWNFLTHLLKKLSDSR
ncbi:hypothetical protein LCGC14_1044530 [marine sediment metagenome]|uniref:Peptidase M20 dimerisation domain-containing protein n=1 Tax=marine sediment metagenome TaxID=412755 RepID=A0A0F9QWX5_9ZZZZ|nr:beta-Ala-His dipeptidase [archaeon]